MRPISRYREQRICLINISGPYFAPKPKNQDKVILLSSRDSGPSILIRVVQEINSRFAWDSGRGRTPL